jgi:hypothetical protein
LDFTGLEDDPNDYTLKELARHARDLLDQCENLAKFIKESWPDKCEPQATE